MKTFASKEKRSAPTTHKARPYVHHPISPVQLAQQAEIRRILRSTGAQAKLTIGQPNDKYEQEADRVADQVMAMPDLGIQRQPPEDEENLIQTKPNESLLQRQPGEEEDEEELQTKPLNRVVQRQTEEEEELQAKSKPGENPAVTPSLESRINSLKGGGQPLAPAIRDFFEPRFGHNFRHVRVHTDITAADTAKSINAKAFTMGGDVVFGDAQYQPDSTESKKLLAHELTHVVQQPEKSEQPLWRSSLLQRAPSLIDPQELKLVNARPPMARDFDGVFAATVFFGRGQFYLDQPNTEAIEGIGLLLSFIPGARVFINGHASTESSSSFNEILSKNRLEAVVILLSTHSFGTPSISKNYSGEKEPLVEETGTGSTLEQKRQWNRRVEIMVIKPPPPPIRLFPNMVVPEVTGPKDKGEPGMTTGGETPPVPPSTYKQLEERFNKLQNNPFMKRFLAPSLEEIMKRKGPFFKFKLELP